jgi:Zn-dependent protease
MFTIFEILDIAVMTVVIGFLFKEFFRLAPGKDEDILAHYRSPKRFGFGRDFWWACAIIAPSLILHELGHKFTGMAFGLQSTFHAACSTAYLAPGGMPVLDSVCLLSIVMVLLKLAGIGVLFIIPGYVVTQGATLWQHTLIAAAGPAVHLIFWLGTAAYMKSSKRMRKLPERKRMYLVFFRKINMWLFVLNMLPIPILDGWDVYVTPLLYLFGLR